MIFQKKIVSLRKILFNLKLKIFQLDKNQSKLKSKYQILLLSFFVWKKKSLF